MTDARYTLSARQAKDMQLGVIRVAVPIPADWPDELWDAPDDLQDLCEWAAASLGVLDAQVAGAAVRHLRVAPGRKAEGLTGLIGRIVQDYDPPLWSIQVACVVATLRGASPIRLKPGPIQWPRSVLCGDWRYPPSAE